MFASKGSFTSMNYPDQYPLATKRDCMWIITTTQNKPRDSKHPSLTLLFDKFNVGTPKSKTSGLCEDDYIEVREGKGFLSPYIVRYCGDITPLPITTMSGSLYVRFHMSGKRENKSLASPGMLTGFKADFKTDSKSFSPSILDFQYCFLPLEFSLRNLSCLIKNNSAYHWKVLSKVIDTVVLAIREIMYVCLLTF